MYRRKLEDCQKYWAGTLLSNTRTGLYLRTPHIRYTRTSLSVLLPAKVDLQRV
jgi:hypothetical protein